MYKCPICGNETNLEICPICAYDLENDYVLNNLTYSLSSLEIEKYQERIKIIKEIYQRNISKQKINDNQDDLNKLGDKYFYGKDVQIDYQKAKVYYEKAADLGDVEAMYKLGCMYHYGYGGIGKNYQKAKKYYEQAASLGYKPANNSLEILYKKGLM